MLTNTDVTLTADTIRQLAGKGRADARRHACQPSVVKAGRSVLHDWDYAERRALTAAENGDTDGAIYWAAYHREAKAIDPQRTRTLLREAATLAKGDTVYSSDWLRPRRVLAVQVLASTGNLLVITADGAQLRLRPEALVRA